nr:MAG TPA: hypothetical protein [Caudoviricetes sp.]
MESRQKKSICKHLFPKKIHRKIVPLVILLTLLRPICKLQTHLILKESALVQTLLLIVAMNKHYLRKASDMLLQTLMPAFAWTT